MPSTSASQPTYSASSAHTLGAYLKDRRTKLDPAALGLPAGRRRTPGLRREEVAQRANVSATWYTWLEQGRGGAPSAEVLDRIAQALMLTDVEREHLYLLGLGHPPEVRYDGAQAAARVSPRLQRVLDSLELSPALVKTATWDIVAWNRAAAAVFEYGAAAPVERNILRRLFCNPDARAWQRDWESVARFVVAAFRADVLRAGASAEVEALVDDLNRRSPEFETMWRDHDVRTHGEGSKHLLHPVAGPIELEFSSFAVDGRPELGMVIYTPVTPADAHRISALIDAVPQTLVHTS
ncbi:helix-turn-helix transcriptional regulator [Paraburkholderia sp. SARCC-3016]|uniref:helix-turn-helix transcriptional regulator n=1 Tax=Paraburkholderia sp. SARCC-3016 TaxID=3058611 RepID=UPI00280779D7|nr:helix-turn-helix transcriptional regulator [Paraburkholderia sp. SARCC-3016]MDQ7977932.1 helix-turn-helix transcriptional regulator [Paraburkholderia sp. SARCC-3016]